MTTSSRLLSPRLVRLQYELEQGHTSALPSFWQDIARQGSPLIEPIENDPAHFLVSFLWRDDGNTRSVVLVGGPAYLGTDNQMQRLLSTDLWYKTYQAPADLRATYKFLLNEQLSTHPDEQEMMNYALCSHVDPFNPNQISAPHLLPDRLQRTSVSLLELPHAPASPWTITQPHIPHGNIKLFMLNSSILHNTYHLAIYTPPGYKPTGKPYKLLLLFDSWMYMDAIPAPTIMDNLLHARAIDPHIIVMHSHLEFAARNRELSYSRLFTDFLAHELIPWLHQRYHITSDPTQCIIGGASLGGVAATFSALTHPELFGNVLSQSGSFGATTPTLNGQWLIQQFAQHPMLPLRFSLEVGSLERIPNFDHLTANLHLRDVLLTRGYEVHFTQFHGTHDAHCWRASFADHLLHLQYRQQKAG